MELRLRRQSFYVVKRGQTLEEIALAFSVPPALLAKRNHILSAEEGQILSLPVSRHSGTVRGGESKSLYCGSPERFFTVNGTGAFYPCMRVYFGEDMHM